MISYPPTTTPPQFPAPATTPSGATKANGRRYQMIFASVFAGLTVLALALAAIAPDLNAPSSGAIPSSWQPIYQHDLTVADNAAWDLTHGCEFTAQGLDASPYDSNEAICEFTPSGVEGVTGSGFYFELTVAPAAQVAAFQRAQLLVGDPTNQSGNVLGIEIDQQGSYLICDSNCTAGQGVYISSGTAAWHGDPFVANTIGVKVSADHSQETFYVNGQQVATVTVDMGPSPALAAGAPVGSEAIFTHATLSTGD